MQHDTLRLTVAETIDSRWRVDKFLFEGHFRSFYYKVTDITRPLRSYCMKIESNATQRPDEPTRFLILEKKLLKALKERNAWHSPGLEAYGENERFKYLVMGLLGRDLNRLASKYPEHRFTLRTAMHVAQQSFLCVEEFHYVGFLHRNIKPANMCTGRAPVELKKIYLTNYELCRNYVNENGELLPARHRAPFRGSPRFASVNALEEREQSRVDDIWSWLFASMELMLGKLPWDNTNDVQSDPSTRLAFMSHLKQEIINNPDRLLAGCPREFRKIVDHLKELRFEDKPNYVMIFDTIKKVTERKRYTDDMALDWEPQPRSLRSSRSGAR